MNDIREILVVRMISSKILTECGIRLVPYIVEGLKRAKAVVKGGDGRIS